METMTMPITTTSKLDAKVVTPAEWLSARKELLVKEKEFTRLRDDLARRRREMPWEKVDKSYVFDGANGKESLTDLFDGRSQLIVYHFMFGPGWKEGCPACSYLSDGFDGAIVHLAHRDTAFVAVSRTSLPEIQGFKKRMGWQFKWVSSSGSDFNFDYHVSFPKDEAAKAQVNYNYSMVKFSSEELPGMSVFYRNEAGEIFHTYSTYARGLDILLTTYNLLDHTPKGRDEDAPQRAMGWLRHHDRYEPRSTEWQRTSEAVGETGRR